ncbi:hypothetical protein ACJX0J_012794, partial [Zea mays]
MAAVNLLAESAAVRLRASAPPGAGEELAARLTECRFPATARRGGAVAGAGESARKWREMAARKEEFLLRSRGRVAWTIVALLMFNIGVKGPLISLPMVQERFLDLLHNPYVKCGIATTALFGFGR